MPKVRYNIVKSNAKGQKEYHIRLVFRYDGKRLVYYPGHTIKPGDWNAKEQRCRKTSALHGQINARLDILAKEAERIYLEHSTNAVPLTTDRFRAILDAFWKGRTNQRSEPVELLEFLESAPKERHSAGEIAKDTLRSYSSLHYHLSAFEAASRRQIRFSAIDLDFLPDFVAFLQMRGAKPNTVSKMVKTLKAIMNLALDRGLTNNTAHQSPRFTARGEKVEHIYLSERELEMIELADLPPALDNARNLFLLGCCTGLRFSDLTALSADCFSVVDGVEMITITTKKTGVRISAPVLPMARRILDKCQGFPRAITNQVLNRYVKEVCRLAGITQSVASVRIRSGKRIETRAEKWTLVTTHTARRSFATNEYLRAVQEGRDWRPIMAITGHKKEAQFFEYIRVTSEQNAVLFSKGRRSDVA